MINVRRIAASLIAEVELENGKLSRIDISNLLVLGEDYRHLLDPIVRHLNRGRPKSQILGLHRVQLIGQGLQFHRYISLPTDQSHWQDFVIRLFEFVLSRKESQQRLDTRLTVWNKQIVPLLTALRDAEEVIPLTVEIPRPSYREEIRIKHNDLKNLLGDQSSKRAGRHVNKLLAEVSLAIADDDYLEKVRDLLSYRRRVLKDCLTAWWQQIKDHYEYGQQLLARTEWKVLKAELDANRHRHGQGKSGRTGNPHIANGRTEVALGNCLAILVNEHNSMCTKEILSSTKRLPDRGIVRVPPSAPRIVSPYISVTQRLNWMLGNLSTTDTAVCMGLLIMQMPQLTSRSLLFARIIDKKGHVVLEAEGSSYRFRVDKPRARSMKGGKTDEIAKDVLSSVVAMTKPLRRRLREQKSPLASMLFISSVRGGIQHPGENVVTFLSGSGRLGHSLTHHFPELKNAGLSKGTITFSKIRATEGVLEWFRTGSVASMARKLGNTTQVVLNHYLPESLLARWNIRLIRRFQNLWISVAAANEDFLLQVTDFGTLGDLHAFLADMLQQHSSTSSPLATAMHEAFAVDAPPAKQAGLMVSISTQTLAALYLYQDAAIAAGMSENALNRPDALTNIKPRQFLTLAQLLRHQLPLARDSRMREAHAMGCELAERLRKTIRWEELMIRKEAA